MNKLEAKEELMKYVAVLEANYKSKVQEMQENLNNQVKQREKIEKKEIEKSKQFINKNELEMLFTECMEDVRKDVMKRRLRNEIYNKKRFKQIDRDS
jgi:hypothetical protein